MRVIGLMSGTSLDGIDAALIDIERRDEQLWIDVIAFMTRPIASDLREQVNHLLPPLRGSTEEVCAVHQLLGAAFADAAEAVLDRAGLAPTAVDLIGSHGQTVYHQVAPGKLRSTLQLGAAAAIAVQTGCTVVSDFRSADIALGGQGAPLVPYLDRLLFSDARISRASQNIGGMGNVTYLPPSGDVIAFDTGPGNVLIDEAMRLLTDGDASMDHDGRMAAAGVVDRELLDVWLAHPYFQLPPPKSTGRELWGAREARQYVEQAQRQGLTREDTIATLTALTAQSIARAYRTFLGQVDEVVVAGGGARNPVLLDMLRAALPTSRVLPSDNLGLDADAKEAVTFALLAYATIHGWPGNIPSATGAGQPVVLGTITPGTNYRDLLRSVVNAPINPPQTARLHMRPISVTQQSGQVAVPTDLLLGIDGGGSKTRAVLADRSGVVLGTGFSGSSNYQAVGFTAATNAIWSAIDAAATQAHLDSTVLRAGKAGGVVAAICLGLAGVGRPDDRARFEGWLREQAITDRISIVSDAELLLAGGTPDGWGLALVCGTGSICYGRAPGGTIVRAGGWGYLLGDEGSGYDIGRHALRLATQTADGRAQAQLILATILAHWQLQDPVALIARIYRGNISRPEIAALAELIVTLAAGGDIHAQRILQYAADELIRLVETVASRLQIQGSPLALGGSLLRTGSYLYSLLVANIGQDIGPLHYVDDPSYGAIVIAQHILDS